MIEVNIICVGNLKEEYLRKAAAEYQKRLSRFCRLHVTEVSEENSIEKEKKHIMNLISGYKIALCIEGDKINSKQLAEKIEKISMQNSKISFIIGSSEGLSEEIKNHADMRLSFSDMTFPHQLMRVMVLEQIYRAFTINNNVKYHK